MYILYDLKGIIEYKREQICPAANSSERNANEKKCHNEKE
jgi:hypothetical protein